MAKKTETKTEKLEREYTIPLREKCRPVPRYRKTEKAIKTIREFLVRHMKIRDRDLNKIKIEKNLNEVIWLRGIKKPPHKIKVKAIKEGGIVRVEAMDLPKRIEVKKTREAKIIARASEAGKKKKAEQKAAGQEAEPLATSSTSSQSKAKTDEEKKDEAEKKTTEKKKVAAGAETAQKAAEAAAKATKKQKAPKVKQPKRPQRKALAK